jgi:tetratricopeptide (TPR) repeat protein
MASIHGFGNPITLVAECSKVLSFPPLFQAFAIMCTRALPRVVTFLVVVLSAAPAFAQSQVTAFLNILPGTTTKAEVDLAFGDPRRRVSQTDEIYDYSAPRGTEDADHIEVTFFADTRTVARIDVYFKAPVPADPLRERIGGTRVVSRPHPPAGLEELFYPRLHGLVVSSTGADAQALAFCYLSQRYLASVYIERFDSLLAGKQYDAALVEAEKAAVVDADGAQGYLAQARYYEAIGNRDEAMAQYTTAGNAKTGQREKYRAAVGLAALYENYRKAPDRAEAEYKRGLSLAMRADAAEARVLFGGFLLRQKKPEDARAEFQRAVELDATSMTAQAALGNLRWDAKEYKEALENYQAIVNAPPRPGAPPDPNHGLMLYRYGFTLAEAGRVDEALAAYQQALALKSGAPGETRYQVAMLYARKNDHVRAIAEFREGLKASPGDLGLNAGLTNSLIVAGLAPDAMRQAELSLKLAPSDPRRLFEMARAWGLQKKKKESIDFVRRAIAAGFADRKALTTDPALAQIQNEGDFKKLITQIR